jgi:hypothetical protein
MVALLFGLEFPNPDLSGEPSPLPNDHTMVLAQTQTDESDKMNTPGVTGEANKRVEPSNQN